MNEQSIELFCGSGKISAALNYAGFKTFTVDKRKRDGKCNPDFRKDILKIAPGTFPINSPAVIWAAIPCDAYSNAAGNYYRDGNGYKETTKYFQSLLKKSLSLIEEISAELFFIENPRGSLRYNKLMIDFLARNNGTIKECTLGSYGFPLTKPTDIFTNFHSLKLRSPLPFGRGYKNNGALFNRMTKSQRQSTPYELGLEIALQVRKYIEDKNRTEISALNKQSLNAVTTQIPG